MTEEDHQNLRWKGGAKGWTGRSNSVNARADSWEWQGKLNQLSDLGLREKTLLGLRVIYKYRMFHKWNDNRLIIMTIFVPSQTFLTPVKTSVSKQQFNFAVAG